MIDIVIPTRNRAEVLKLVISSYLKQKFLNKIIIIDDASDRENKELYEKLSSDYSNIIYKSFNRQIFLPQARNEGISLSQSEYIFMGEDDVYLEDNHLEVLYELIKKYDADLIAGRRIYIKENQSFEDAKRLANKDKRPVFTKFPLEGYFERFFEDDMIDVLFLHSNVLFKKKICEKVLFDPWYKGNAFREELDFFLNCLANNLKMVLTNKTSCFHLKDNINKEGGARMNKFIYEYYVWKNTFYCFFKNRQILKNKLRIRFPLLYAFLSLIWRYPYAVYRRTIWKVQKIKNY